jgi:hypothetical protein
MIGFTTKIVAKDLKVYEVTFVGSRCTSIRIHVPPRWRKPAHWRLVWDDIRETKSAHVQSIIALASQE